MENWLSGLGFWQKRENFENRDFHDLGHVEDAFRRKIDVGSVLVCRRGILERMPSLQAGRAETMVDGLPRACRFYSPAPNRKTQWAVTISIFRRKMVRSSLHRGGV